MFYQENARELTKNRMKMNKNVLSEIFQKEKKNITEKPNGYITWKKYMKNTKKALMWIYIWIPTEPQLKMYWIEKCHPIDSSLKKSCLFKRIWILNKQETEKKLIKSKWMSKRKTTLIRKDSPHIKKCTALNNYRPLNCQQMMWKILMENKLIVLPNGIYTNWNPP